MDVSRSVCAYCAATGTPAPDERTLQGDPPVEPGSPEVVYVVREPKHEPTPLWVSLPLVLGCLPLIIAFALIAGWLVISLGR